MVALYKFVSVLCKFFFPDGLELVKHYSSAFWDLIYSYTREVSSARCANLFPSQKIARLELFESYLRAIQLLEPRRRSNWRLPYHEQALSAWSFTGHTCLVISVKTLSLNGAFALANRVCLLSSNRSGTPSALALSHPLFSGMQSRIYIK